MALNFPASPIQGQLSVQGNGITYQWDGAKWSANVRDSYANSGANPGVTPPANPAPGTFWWDSESGQLYIWYTDTNATTGVSSSQWMPASVLGKVYDSEGNVVTTSQLQSEGVATGTLPLTIGLEGNYTYDGTIQYDKPLYLEQEQEVTVTTTNTSVS